MIDVRTRGRGGGRPLATEARPAALPDSGLTLLVIEDDPAGSLNVPDLLDSAGKPIRVRTARNLTEAERLLTDDVHCILLDLRPCPAPDRHERPTADDELAVLKHVLELAPRHAVLALTDAGDAERGAEAVRVGAQDYLFRDELDGRLLSRAIRYAVERKRSDMAAAPAHRVQTARPGERPAGARSAAHAAAGGLRPAVRRPLPARPLPRPARRRLLRHRPHPGRHRARHDRRRLRARPRRGGARRGAADRLAGADVRRAVRRRTAGHTAAGAGARARRATRSSRRCARSTSPPTAAAPGSAWPATRRRWLARPRRRPRRGCCRTTNSGPALGLLPNARWPRTQVELGGAWSLMLYTDGLIEGRIGAGQAAAGPGRHGRMVRRQLAEGLRGEELLRAAVTEVRDAQRRRTDRRRGGPPAGPGRLTARSRAAAASSRSCSA